MLLIFSFKLNLSSPTTNKRNSCSGPSMLILNQNLRKNNKLNKTEEEVCTQITPCHIYLQTVLSNAMKLLLASEMSRCEAWLSHEFQEFPVPQKIVLFSELNSHKVHSISQNNCQVHRAGNTAAFDEPESSKTIEHQSMPCMRIAA